MEGPYPGLYLEAIRNNSQARISLRAHNVEHQIWERKAFHEKSLLKRGYLKNMAKRLKRYELELARTSDVLIPISEMDASCFRENGLHLPLLTIPAGLSMDTYPITALPDRQSIFYIGALDWLPNQEGLRWFLRNVFDHLLSELPDLQFHVAGRNAPAHFEKKLKHPNIIYHGEVENAINFMQSHRIMVAPLLTGSGIRVKILEGMALGRPVVTTPAGIEGIPAINQKHVYVEDDPALFSASLIKLLRDTAECKRMLDDARKFVGRHFDTFELSARLSQFYKTEE
jgi:glycosyltransferase involved in cell wall biosynthesis